MNVCILQMSSSKNGGKRKGLGRVQASRNTKDRWDGGFEQSGRVDLVSWVIDLVGLISWGATLRMRGHVVHIHRTNH